MSSTSQNLTVEFTVEPFVPANPGPHVLAAQAATEPIAEAGGTVDIGPFGTSATGDERVVLAAIGDALALAFANGAVRVSLQVSRDST